MTGNSRDDEPQAIEFDRPLLLTELELPGTRGLDIINLHLRAPRASAIAGEKLNSSQWRTTSGWAEGYFLSSLKRTAQALELRLLVDDILDRDPERLIGVAGDFNAEDHETPVRIAAASEGNTGNPALASRSLRVLDRAIPGERRWSVLHGGRPEMLDHILASQSLYSRLRGIEAYNESLGDEMLVAGAIVGSSHAAVVAEFALD